MSKLLLNLLLMLLLLFMAGCGDEVDHKGKKEIDPTPDLYHIVVIGSSTAEGIGPDYGWVDRVRDQLQWINSGHQVTNLAKGGYNSFRYLPDGTAISNGETIDSGRNITKAISLNPDFIILNNPSNDIWLDHYNIDTLFQNYATIIAAADGAKIPIYITTSQSTLYDQGQRDRLIAIKDRAITTFGDQLLDFWSGIAAADGSTLEQYRTEDNVHLNDAAHHILAKRVLEKLPLTLEAAPTDKMIHYKTGWSTPHIHYLQDSGNWTTAPGSSMSSEGDGWFTITVADQGRIEFVFNDGSSNWDNNQNSNYHTTLKEFWVKDGIISSSKPQ